MILPASKGVNHTLAEMGIARRVKASRLWYYMMEFPIARLYADSRVQMIYGGTNEIMNELIARSLDV